MFRTYRLWTLLAAGLVLFACQKERTNQDSALVSSEKQLTFTATIDGAGTRTALDGSKITWNPAEAINIFYGASGGSCFVSTNTEPSQSVSFSGTLTAFTGTTESGEANSFWAIYPYQENNSSDGTRVTAYLPDHQVGVAENIPDATMLMVAKAPGLALAFKQVCAMLRVIVDTPDIERIEIHGNNNETIAGRILVKMDAQGNPEWQQISEASGKKIELTPSGTTFEQADYYVPLLPQEFSEGFTITCYKAGGKGSYSTGKVTFGRNQTKSVRTSRVTEWEITPPDNEIWYTSTDGEVVPYATDESTGNEVVSNTYSDGKGIVKFAGNLEVVDKEAFYYQPRLATVTLPERVTKIDVSAFYACYGLEEVNLGGSVQIIAEMAFYNCRFPEIQLPPSLVAIGASSFAFNYYLQRIHLPESVVRLGYVNGGYYYFYDNPFAGCLSLQEFSGSFASDDGLCLRADNGDGEKYALVSVALGCGLDTYRVPDGATYVVSRCFAGAPFKEIDLNGTAQIDEEAFFDSTLEHIRIPASVAYISSWAFSSCRNLTDMWFESGVLPRLYGSDALGSLDGSDHTQFTIHIPGSATSLSANDKLGDPNSQWYQYLHSTDRIELYQASNEIWYHFTGSSSFGMSGNYGTESNPVSETRYSFFPTDVYPRFVPASPVPDGSEFSNIYVSLFDGTVTAVPTVALKDKTELDFISLPSTVESVGTQSFSGCTSLTRIDLPNVTTLGQNAFEGCTSLASALLGGVATIPANAFHNCYNLESVILPAHKVKTVGDYAFSMCYKLTQVSTESYDYVNLPAVTRIGLGAFTGAVALKRVVCPNLVDLDASAFASCYELTSVSLPKVTRLQPSCFLGNRSLTDVYVPEVFFINTNVFNGCTSLKTLALPKIQRIRQRAFAKTRSLETLDLGADLESIGNEVFYDDDASARNTDKLTIILRGRKWYDNEGNPSSSNNWDIWDAFNYNLEETDAYFQFKNMYVLPEISADFQQYVQYSFGTGDYILDL